MKFTKGQKHFYDPKTNETGYYFVGQEPQGWILGEPSKIHICELCGKSFQNNKRFTKYCDSCKPYSQQKHCKVCGSLIPNTRNLCDNKECHRIMHSDKNAMKNHINVEKAIRTKQEKYGYDYGSKVWYPKFEATMVEKYGVRHALESDQFKGKMEETIKKRGVSFRFHTPEWDEMMIERYGTTIPNKNVGLNTKQIQTLIDRYGVTSPTKLDWVKERSKKTCLEKYGVEYYFQSDEMKQKTKVALEERYGVKNAGQLNAPISNINKKIGEYLSVDKYEVCLEGKRYDCLKDYTLIEINPTISHSLDNTFFGSKELNYHIIKTKLAESKGYRCIHIWDWDDIAKIKAMLEPKTIVYGRKCEVAPITKNTCDAFLDRYHLQNSCSSDKLRFGLILDDQLIGVMTFGNPRYNSKYQVELLRLCYHPKFKVIGGSEKLFKFFVNTYHPESIISYCDRSKFTGNVYTRLGMELISENNPSIHWYNIDKKKHFTNNLLVSRGADALLGTHYGKGSDNEKIMHEYGFLRVADCGQQTYGISFK